MRRNKDVRVGDQVEVARDIFRIPNPRSAEEGEQFKQRWHNFWMDRMSGRDSCAPPNTAHSLYAKEGERGVVLAFIESTGTVREPQAQVQIGGEIKTLRRTSLRRVDAS